MKAVLAATVLLTLAMTALAAMSPEMKEEVDKMMGSVMGDLETMMEEKKGGKPEAEMSQRSKDEVEMLRGLMAGLKGEDPADPFDALLNPRTRRKRWNLKTWLSFGVDVGKAFYNRFLRDIVNK